MAKARITKFTTIGKQVDALSKKHAACNYLLDEIMSLLGYGTSPRSAPTHISAKHMEWVDRTYKKYREMG